MAQEIQTFGIMHFLGRITEYAEVLLNSGMARVAKDIDWRSAKGALRGGRSHELLYSTGSDLVDYVVAVVVYQGSPFYCTQGAGSYYAADIKKVGGASGVDWQGKASFTEIDGWLIGVNGNKNVKFNGTTLYEFGLSQPTVGSFAAAGSGSGSFTVGDWKYQVVFGNANGQESIASSSITATNQGASKAKVAITGIPTGTYAEGVTYRKIYRTVTGGTTFYLLTTIANNTTTTYDDTTTDGNLGTSSPSALFGKAPIFSCIERVDQRLYGAGYAAYPRRLYYSLPIPYYEAFPPTYYADFPENIVGIKRCGNELLVLTEASPYIFYNLDNVTSMAYRDLPRSVPGSSARNVKPYGNQVFWYGPMGVYKTSGSYVDEDSELVRGLFPAIVSAGDMEFDSYGDMYTTLDRYDAFSAEVGKIVDITQEGDTVTFSAEVGRIVRISSVTSTYSLSAEYGRISIFNLGSGDEDYTGTIIRTQWLDDTIWSLDTQLSLCFACDNTSKALFVGMADGLYRAFTGSRRAWEWRSIHSYLDLPLHRKNIQSVRLRVNGTVTVSLYGDDDVLLHTEVVTTTQMQTVDVILPWDSWAYTISIRLEGAADSSVEPPLIYYYIPEVL